MKRAFLYCRVSAEEQSRPDHHSLDYQEDHGRRSAKAHDWRVAKVRKDVGFVSTSEHFDTTTAMGRAMLGVAAVFAQLTREMIGENLRDGMAKRAQSGKYTGPTTNPRFGYDYSPKEGKLLVEPENPRSSAWPSSCAATASGAWARSLFHYGHRKPGGAPKRARSPRERKASQRPLPVAGRRPRMPRPEVPAGAMARSDAPRRSNAGITPSGRHHLYSPRGL